MSQFTVVSADQSVSVELHPDRWVAVDLAEGLRRVIFEAVIDGTLTSSPQFNRLQKLPAGGVTLNELKSVVLGWSPTLMAWQLGFVVKPELAAQRMSRWVELVRWQDEDGARHNLAANRAAQALARVTRLPLKVIPPKALPSDDAPAEPVPLPPLPIDLGTWELHQAGDVLEFALAGRWRRSRVGRILWYGLWTVVFIAVSVLSLTVELALPNAGTLLPAPHLLPYMGIFVATILVFLIIKNSVEIARQPTRIVVDPATSSISARLGRRTTWAVPSRAIDSVYVSEVLSHRGKRLMSQHAEINLRVGPESFRHMLTIEDELDLGAKNGHKIKNAVEPMADDDADTPLSNAAIYVSRALGNVPIWRDQRPG
ncbi:MAG: hypothetical protein IPM16_02215 [Chloroflexi bacterium]|nr:hypothetical protein [Chloroflexota bacterium]